MMTLDELYEIFATGELAQVIMGNSDILDRENPNGVPKTRYAQLRNSVQLGLTDLHKRLAIKERSVLIEVTSGPGIYELNRKFAVSNDRSREPKYILDSAHPFLDDALKIIRVKDYYTDDTKRQEYLLNVLDNKHSLNTPTVLSIEIPKGFKAPMIEVAYRANHPIINAAIADSAPLAVDIDLDQNYVRALSLFVASRVMNPIGISGEAFHAGNNYFAQYMGEIADLRDHGHEVKKEGNNSRLERSGWA